MKILVSAFEHSANVHLKALTREFTTDVELVGVFDASLGQPIIDLRALAVMGIVDAVKKLPFFLGLSKEMLSLVPEVDKVLLIDSSGFNLPLAKKIKKRYPDKEIIYYILPQAWAWKKKRIPVLARTIDHLASILPFEPAYYPEGAPIEYVGHPLLDEIPKFKERRSLGKKIAFMPGSRRSEIEKLMPHYIALQKALDCDATLIVPEHFKDKIEELYGDVSSFKIAYDAHRTLYESDFAFICSGTATLEAVLIGTPFILSYIARKLDFFIGTSLLKIEYIGLGNIMFTQFEQRPMHPELWQNEVTLENLLDAYQKMDQEKFFEDALKLSRVEMAIKISPREAQYRAHKEDFDKLLLRSATKEELIGADNVAGLESALAAYVGAEGSIACNSQFNAFVLLFMALGLKAGDEVITSVLGSGVAAEAVLFMGGKPVFVDINRTDYTIDVSHIEDAITERTKIIIPVSIFGRCAEMESINALARQHDLCVIEDAAQSFGASYHGSRSCSLSKLATTSFHPDMPLGAFGNGAALFIEDSQLRAKTRELLSLGKSRDAYVHIGIDAAMDEIQAAVVNYKLSLFDGEMDRRRSLYGNYAAQLKTDAIATPGSDKGGNFAYYPVCAENRAALVDRLGRAGIESLVPFTKPLHLHEAFAVLNHTRGDFPVAEKVVDQLLLLPIHAYMDDSEQSETIRAVMES